MVTPETGSLLDRNYEVRFRDRCGHLHAQAVHVHEVRFMSSGGACMIGDTEDIWLDQVISITHLE